ncbi:MAG: hypothetical protein FJ118_04100 [Deltaproteobacteria bacterium]|nr:hypothetical protein [Deltaproteobacteria bacterium]
MATDRIDTRAVQGVLYGIYKALHGVVGENSAAVMRRAAPDILDMLGKLGVDFSCVDDVNKLSAKLGETMVQAGMCENMAFTLNGSDLTADITQCSFYPLTMKLKEEGIPPFGCPFAALTIAIAEKNLGKRARLKFLEPVGKPGDTRLIVELTDK